jgi:hypothetical protein
MLGGRHPGEGTHNALLRLGPRAYLELIAPDPSRKRSRPPWFGLDTLTSARLVGWAVKSTDLIRRAAAARSERVPVGEVRSGRREDSSGHVLSWRLTYPASREEAGIVPFLIDWGDSPHPADAAPQGLALIDLRAEHPDPASVIQHLRHLGLELRVLPGPRPALIATVDTPRGLVELR